MSPGKQYAALVVFYTAIIVGTMYGSGKLVEQTIYDRYIVSLEGAVISVSDIKAAAQFYESVLDFPRAKGAEDTNNSAIFELPDTRKLFLQTASDNDSSEIVIRVRNGFDKLHQKIVEKSGHPAASPQTLRAGQIGQIQQQPWGREFVAIDNDNNRVVYLFARRRSKSRF